MIIVNGTTQEFTTPRPLPELLQELGFADKPVVVELNREALSPSEFSKRVIQDGDSLEIITIAAGG